MVESKDNVKVAVRIRPLNDRELQETSKKCVTITEECRKLTLADHKSFTYDYIADESTSQEKLFEMVGRPIAGSCMSGYNGTIFAYGQTGSGKTFTIQGQGLEESSSEAFQHPLRGILPRCFEYIFGAVSSALKAGNSEFLIKCSYLEIYQEQINDLLDPNPHNLLLREDMKKGPYVEGLIEEKVSNLIQTYALLKTGARNRHVSSTSMNKESSRSHSVFTLHVESKNTFDGLTNFKSSRFNLIDLAGSERQKFTACVGERLKEAGMINKSLSALGNVINSLVEVSEGKQRHIPYRDSKLTFLLKDSLGGNSKTFIIANISPSISSLSETLSTLKFAQRAKLIRNSAVINEDTSGTVMTLKAEIKRLKAELEAIQQVAQVAITTCPKCAGLSQVDLPGLLSSFEKNTESEVLLEQNLRLRLEHERKWDKSLADKDLAIENLRNVVQKLENKVNHDKMIIKFRDATIVKLQNGLEDKDVEALRKENEGLRSEIENNPITARLTAENKILNEEIAEMRLELENGYGSLRQQNAELKDFTEKLCESLRVSALEREKIKMVVKEITAGVDLNLVFQNFEENYEKKIGELSMTLKDLQKEHSQVLAENQMIHLNYMEHFEGDDNLLDSRIEEISPRISLRTEDEYRRLEKEMEELKLKLLNECQLTEKLTIEKRNLEKTCSEALQENLYLKDSKDKLTILEGQIEVLQSQVEEKYAALMQSSQDVDNLTESNDFLKGEISRLTSSVHLHKEKNQSLEIFILNLEKQISEQNSLIVALHEPTGNKTLALALNEVDSYKQKCQELEAEINCLKKSLLENQNNFQNLVKIKEAAVVDLQAANEILTELKLKLAENSKKFENLQDKNLQLEEELENLKEIAERDKNHANILKERTLVKHNEALMKVNNEKNELEKEIDLLKNKLVNNSYDLNEVKKTENDLKARLSKEIKKSEILCHDLIDLRVDYESQLKVSNDRIFSLKDELEKVEEQKNVFGEQVKELQGKIEERGKEIEKTISQFETTIRILGEESVKKEKSLKDEISNLLLESNILIVEKKKLEEEKNQLELDFSEIQKDLTEKDKKIKEIFQENKEVNEILNKVKDEYQQKTLEIEKVRLELDSVSSEKELFSLENQKLLYQNEESQVELNLLRIEKSNFEFELKLLTQEKEKSKNDLDVLRVEHKKILEKFNQTTEDFNLIKEEKMNLTTSFENLTVKNLEITENIENLSKILENEMVNKEELENLNKNLKISIESSFKEIQDKEMMKNRLEEELMSLSKQNENLSKQNNEILIINNDFEKKVSHLVKENEDLAVKISENIKLTQTLQENLTIYSNEKQRLNDLLSQKSQEIQENHKEIEKTNKRLEESTLIIKNLEESLKSAEGEHRAEVIQITQKNQLKLEETSENFEKQLKTLHQSKNDAIQEIQTKIDQISSQFQLKSSELQEKNKNLELAYSKTEKLEKELNVLMSDYQEKSSQIKKIKDENESLSTEIAVLTETNKEKISLIKDLEQEALDLKEELKKLRSVVEDLTFKHNKVNSQLEAKESLLNEQVKQNQAFELIVNEKDEKIKSFLAKIKEIEEKSEEIKKLNFSLEEEKKVSIESIETFQKTLKKLNETVTSQDLILKETITSKSTLEIKSEEQNLEINKKSEKINEMTETILMLKKIQETLNNDLETINGEKKLIQQELKIKDDLLIGKASELEHLKEVHQKYEEKISCQENLLESRIQTIKTQENEIKTSADELILLKNKLEDNEKELSKVLNEIQETSAKIEKIERENLCLNEVHEKEQGEILLLKEEAENSKKSIQDLQITKEKQEETIKKLTFSYEEKEKKCENFSNLIESQKVQIEEKITELHLKFEENKEINKEIEKVTTEQQETNKKLIEAKAENQNLREKIQVLNKKINDLELSLESKTTENSFISTRIIENEKIIEEFKEEFEKSLKTIETKEKNIQDSNEKIQDLLKKLENSTQNLESNNKNLAEKTEKIQVLTKKLEEFQKQADSKDQKLKESVEKVSELFNIIDEKTKKSKDQEHLCIDLINEKETTKIQIESLESQIASLKETLNKVQNNLEESKILSLKLENERNDLKFSFDQLSEEKSRNISEIEEKTTQIIHLELENDRKTEEFSQIQKKNESIEEDLSKFKLLKQAADEEIFKLKLFLNQETQTLKDFQQQSEKSLTETLRKLENLKSENESYQVTLSSKDKEISSITEKMAEVLHENSSMSQTLITLQHEKKLTENLILSLKVQLSEKCENEANFQNTLTKKEEEFKSLIEKLQKIEESSKSQIKELEKNQETLENLLNQNKEQLNQTSSKLLSEQESKTILSSLNQEQSSQIQTFLKQINDLNHLIRTLQNQIKNLQNDLDSKEDEVLDLKGKNSNEFQETFLKSKQEVELAQKLQEAAQSELKSVKSDLVESLNAREGLMSELRTIREDELRGKRDLNDLKRLFEQLKEDKKRLIHQLAKVNEENEKNGIGVESDGLVQMKVRKLEELVSSLEKQLKVKTFELEKCNKKIAEAQKKSFEDAGFRKEVESQAIEIQNLTDGLSQITDAVFNLPLFKGEHPESQIIENTVKAIRNLYAQFVMKEKEVGELKGKKRADSISKVSPVVRGIPRGK